MDGDPGADREGDHDRAMNISPPGLGGGRDASCLDRGLLRGAPPGGLF